MISDISELLLDAGEPVVTRNTVESKIVNIGNAICESNIHVLQYIDALGISIDLEDMKRIISAVILFNNVENGLVACSYVKDTYEYNVMYKTVITYISKCLIELLKLFNERNC